MQKIRFTPSFDKELLKGFQEIAADAGLVLSEDSDAVVVAAVKGDSFSVSRVSCPECNATVKIVYSQNVEFFRAASMLAGFIAGDEKEITQKANDAMLCYMADMSRNAVYNIASAKRMIRYLALMGFNSLMLYTEETYEMPEYPYFGHMRGRFTKSELREIDDYAYQFGIEVIPCIQALAHLGQALRWSAFSKIKDSGSILLVGEEATYDFIKTMLKTCKECFRSRRVNLGMDEAHSLGRGAYMAKHGLRPQHEIMLEHLDRVVAICNEEGVEPMIWSDMFFRMAFNGTYRVKEGEISPEVMEKVPAGLTLIYWDYYSLNRDIFEHMIDAHLKFNNPVSFAGGAWKWSGFAPHNRFSLVSSELQLDICEEKGLKNMIVTAWGDNGGEASQFAPLSVLLYFAERVFASEKVTTELLEKRSEECFGIGFEALLTLDAPNELPGITIDAGKPLNPSRYLLYNDPLEGILDCHFDPETAPAGFKAAAERLEQYTGHETFGYMYETLAALCRLLSIKCDVSVLLRKAYNDKNIDELSALADKISAMIDRLDDFITKFRKQWYFENKTFGFGNQEIRLGGLRARLVSTRARVIAYVNGEIDRIEELEQPCLPFRPGTEGQYLQHQNWTTAASVGIL